MSNQATLTEDAPLTLDTTCSDKKIWPRYASIRMDVRRDVNPEIVADASFLPFRDGVFQKIYCDPPHLIMRKGWEPPKFGRFYASLNRKRYPHTHFVNCLSRYGFWHTQEEWLRFILATNKEFHRCLKESGVLEYKILDGRDKRTSTHRKDLNAMDNFRIDKETITQSPYGKNSVYWLTMKPKSSEKGEMR